jgi:hypothetical protein
MNGHLSSFHPNRAPIHVLAPAMPVRDKDDLNMRVQNFRASIKACPSCWRNYFEALATEMEREMN